MENLGSDLGILRSGVEGLDLDSSSSAIHPAEFDNETPASLISLDRLIVLKYNGS